MVKYQEGFWLRHMVAEKKVCRKCILDESFPGVKIGSDGVCNICNNYKEESLEEKKEEMLKIIDSSKGGKYDIVFALSGGKDSCYTMYVMRKKFPNLRMLGVMLDNGFISDTAKKNALAIAQYTHSDLKIVSAGGSNLNKLFSDSAEGDDYSMKQLERASSICVTCSNLFKHVIFAEAIKNQCSCVAFGWTPGQSINPIVKMNGKLLQWSKKPFEAMLNKTGNTKIIESFLPDDSIYLDFNGILYLLHPLFMEKYDENKMKELLKKEIGWKESVEDDPNTSNCLLNPLAISVHLKKYGFHPYAFEVAGLVRVGALSRKEGFARIIPNFSKESVNIPARSINLPERAY